MYRIEYGMVNSMSVSMGKTHSKHFKDDLEAKVGSKGTRHLDGGA